MMLFNLKHRTNTDISDRNTAIVFDRKQEGVEFVISSLSGSETFGCLDTRIISRNKRILPI